MCTRTGGKIELYLQICCSFAIDFGGISYRMPGRLIDGRRGCWGDDWRLVSLRCSLLGPSHLAGRIGVSWDPVLRLTAVLLVNIPLGRDGDGAAPSDRGLTVGQEICQRMHSTESCGYGGS